MKVMGESTNFVTPLPPISTDTAQRIPTPPHGTMSKDLYKHLNPIKSFPKVLKNVNPVPVTSILKHETKYNPGDNITVYTLDDIDVPLKTIHAEPPLMSHHQWALQNPNPKQFNLDNSPKPHFSVNHVSHTHPEKHINFALADTKVTDITHQPSHDSMRKVSMSSLNNFNYFMPTNKKKYHAVAYPYYSETQSKAKLEPTKISLFLPIVNNGTDNRLQTSSPIHLPHKEPTPKVYPIKNENIEYQSSHGKHITVLRLKDLKPTINYKDTLRSQDAISHVLSRQPNPYETVLLRAVPNRLNNVTPMDNVPRIPNPNLIYPQVPKTPLTLSLEHFLSQMEVESEVNKNLGRSADKNSESAIGQ